MGCSRQAVSEWRIRFCQEGVQGLEGETAVGSAAAFFPRRRSPRSRRWRARCRPSTGCRCHAGRALSWRSRRSGAGSSRRSRRDDLAVAARAMRSSRGNIAPGSFRVTRTSRPKPSGSSICMRVSGRVNRSARRLRITEPMRNPRSQALRCSHPPSAPGPVPSRRWSKPNTPVEALWAISRPTTCAAPRSSAAARPGTESSRSPGWPSR